MNKPKIGCICVTENRSELIKIPLLNFNNQDYCNKSLFISINSSNFGKYVKQFDSIDNISMRLIVNHDNYNVTKRIDILCSDAFTMNCDIVTFFDDDDWSPYDRLSLTSRIFNKYDLDIPLIASYGEGWFCNLRTLRAELVKCRNWPLWGGCLSFNKAAYKLVGGFGQFKCPGYDRNFMSRIANIEIINSEIKPVAFSHGKNVATWLKDSGEPFEDFLIENMEQDEFDNIKKIQKFLIKRRIFPPNS